MTDPQQAWQLAGRGPEAYERYLVPAFFTSCADHLLEAVRLGSGERLLDVACGTGIVARTAANRVAALGAVTGVDNNPGMLDVAASTATNAPSTIEWRSGDAAELPFGDESFDVVCCQQGLQFFSDQLGTLREMRRTLAPDGRLALAVWRPIEHNPIFAVLADALGRHSGAEAADIMRSPFSGPPPDRMRSILQQAELTDPWISIRIISVRFASAEEFLTYETVSSPLAEPVGRLDAAGWRALVADLDQVMAPYAADDGLTFPMQTWIVTAHRRA